MAWEKPHNPWGCSVLVCGLPFLWSLGPDEIRWGTTLAHLGRLLKCPFLREAFSDQPSNKSAPVLSLPCFIFAFSPITMCYILYVFCLSVCFFFYFSPLIEHKQLVPSTLASRHTSNHTRCVEFPLSSGPPYASVPCCCCSLPTEEPFCPSKPSPGL